MATIYPQAPIEDLEGNQIHPITSADQVIMDDNDTRLNTIIGDYIKPEDIGTQVTYTFNDSILTIRTK